MSKLKKIALTGKDIKELKNVSFEIGEFLNNFSEAKEDTLYPMITTAEKVNRLKTLSEQLKSITDLMLGLSEVGIKEIEGRVYCGENLLSEVLYHYEFGNESRKQIKKAIELDMPIMIYTNNEINDGLLYKALKNAGVTTVRNFRIDREINPEIFEKNRSYFTIYLNRKADK